MNREKAAALREIIQITLNNSEHLQKLGVTCSLGNARYDGVSVQFNKLTVIESEKEGAPSNTYELEWQRQCTLYGFKQEDLGRKFTFNGEVFTIAGLRSSLRKYPIIARNTKGVLSKFSAQTVLTFLNKA